LVDPEASYSLTDLVAWSKTSMPTVLREIHRAEAAGIVTTEKVGPTRLVRANPAHPLYDAVQRLVLATYGPPAIVAEEFADIDGVVAVLLFGSWAARYSGQAGRAPNDIDVLVIGNPDRDAVDDAAACAERRIGLPVQATVRTRDQWESRSESFIREFRARPIVAVLVPDDDAEAADLLDTAGADR
jgi:hypothetical protein